VYGCIDIGSNTTRLLVADVSGGRVRAVAARRIFTRIGAGGEVPREKVEQTALVAGALAAEAAEMGARRMVLLGTAAVRDATNGDELRHAVEDATGLAMRVLGGDEEAQLSFAGARQGLEQREVQRLGVVDVGGGSTELATGGPAGPAEWTASVPVGSSVLCRDHPAPDPPEEAHVDAWRAAAAGVMDGVDPPPVDLSLAVGGTATSLHRLTGPRLTTTSLRRALERLCAHPAAEAARRLDLDPERVLLLPAGITVLMAAAARLGSELLPARGGLREGALLELAS
jgi:exopolyphosphatase/guanosine-5'-triphosphate,3'-diphosphate pyrophosphatase